MHSTSKALKWAHPLVIEWFIKKFGSPTEPQLQGWPAILAGRTTLISAPTGSGKTFAAFLACIDQLVRKALLRGLQEETEVLYISPLKALGNDIQKNLLEPLREINELAKQHHYDMQEIRVAVRTGDTLAKERVSMLKKPPHILITTPESFYILLTAEKSRTLLQSIKTVIIDEIHALANDKRGSHLLLSLERLEALTTISPLRIGLSATQKPLETVGQFLTGMNRLPPEIISIGHARHLELYIETPKRELSSVASNEMWDEIYDRLAELIQENRSTLVFVNTRKLAERIAHHLTERIGKEWVATHHGSLSRKLRLQAETKLKNGELKVLVATASLELGIDIGTIDLVCQIGSPRSIAATLQRIGRAGHWHGAISKGRLFATTRDELLECAALIYAIKQGDLDQLIIPDQPLDILAQQITASCATNEWHEEDLFALVKRAYPYRNLTRETFDAITAMLSSGIATSRSRYGAYLFHDKVNGLLKARRGTRLTAITNGGAIPENGLYTVIEESQGVMVGTLDEDFAIESNRGDIILLGTTSWQVKRIESNKGRVLVENAHGAPPSVPFWRGEAPSRTKELSWYVSSLRGILDQMLKDVSLTTDIASKDICNTIDWLVKNTGLSSSSSEQLIRYLLQGRAVLGAIPTQQTIIAERFFDESGGMQLIIHAPFGARINKAWGLALRKRFCRSFNFELQAAATDDGLNISLAEQHSFPLADVFQFLHPNTLKEVLIQAVLQSPLFKIRWRWDAGRSLALIRYRYGKKIPPNIQRMLADDLLAAVFPDAAACQDNLGGRDIELPDHPIINETIKDCLTESLDVEGLIELIECIRSAKVHCLSVDTPLPSPFAHQILNANQYAFLDDVPLEERRARAVELRRFLPNSILEEIGRLDPLAIAEVEEQAWPDIRSADELHDLLQTLIGLPLKLHFGKTQHIHAMWYEFFSELVKTGRVGEANINGTPYWFAAEKAKTFLAIYPNALIVKPTKEVEKNASDQETAILNLVRGFMLHVGPTTHIELSKTLLLDTQTIDQALLQLEATGFILRGRFKYVDESTEWCERRLLARIHRLTLDKLRKEIEPITPIQFMRWLFGWQHLTRETQLQGEEGLMQILKQLQGVELPANAWETQIFSRRVKDYQKDFLDRLTLSGAVGWGRLSPHPALTPNKKNNFFMTQRKVIPTSVAPISFFVREDVHWFFPHKEGNQLTSLSNIAKEIYNFLQQKGASFFSDIARHIHHLKSEIESGLWELIAAGMITADNFDNLRGLIDPRRRLNRRSRMRTTPRHTSGRWAVLHHDETFSHEAQIEASCWLLLKRYGIVFRELLTREKLIPPWRELLLALRRLEDRGEIRGGHFVSGFKGEQFALPYAVESLRNMRKTPASDEIVTISSIDPLNLLGIILPGERVSAMSKKILHFKNGVEQ